MKLLVTYFVPFGGEQENASEQAVRLLPDDVGPWSIYKAQLPVAFGEAGKTALSVISKIRPDAVLCVGQAGGREEITPELVARNYRWARIPDNAGGSPRGESIDPEGEDALFSTLPVAAMTQAIRQAGIPASLSCHAGYYVCNDLYYSLLNQLDWEQTRVAFVHVPKTEQLPTAEVVKGLTAAITAIAV